MRKAITEETVMFFSVLKWFSLAVCVGLIVGFTAAVFLTTLHVTAEWASHIPRYFLALPLGMGASAMLIYYLAPDAEGHGTEKVIEAVHKRAGRIKAVVVPVKLAATVLTIAAGGSAGKEGPCSQIGAGLASSFADLLRFSDDDRRKLVICGISAGFASVFGTPVAGAVFGIEALVVGQVFYDVLLPSFVAGIVSFQVSSALGVAYFHHPLDFVPEFSNAFFLKVAVSGVFFGLCARLFIEVMEGARRLSHSIPGTLPIKGFLGGAAVVLLALVLSPNYLGLGLDSIQGALEGGQGVHWYDFLAKMVFSALTLNFGGSGGLVTPVFFVGSTSGVVFANAFGLDPSTFAAIGMVALLAGGANTPLAASIMAVEMFGPEVAAYASMACIISFLMTGHRSIYPSQTLAFRKSTSMTVHLGGTIHESHPEFHPGRDSVLLKARRAMKRKPKKKKGPAQ